ncbi:hypothetical protein BKA70DRAFT_1283377 [Coprinopsis sp. MPI-PUGE-AT-0042]|nr:hypothetical protein BKA70DRAFT_1283377 [Coprinopsis sp. MPI-PUGE-AT-0042]
MSSLQCIDPNSDIAGVGVRAAIYLQATLTLIQPILAILDGHISEDELDNLHPLYIGILLPGCALLLSAAIHAGKYGVSAYHSTIVLYLSWINNTSALIFFQFALIAQLKLEKERDIRRMVGGMLTLLLEAAREDDAPLELIQRQAARMRIAIRTLKNGEAKEPSFKVGEGSREIFENVFQSLFTLAKGEIDDEWKENVRLMKKRIEDPRLGKPLGIHVKRGRWLVIEKYAQWIRAGAVVDLIERDPVMAFLSSGHLTVVSCFGVWFWFTLNLSGQCEQKTKLSLFTNIPITSQPLRITSIIIYIIGLIPVINIFVWGALQLLVVYIISAIQQLFWKSATRHKQQTLKDRLASVDQPILPWFIGITFVMQVYFIVATEVTINVNEPLLKKDEASLNDERQWTFGQTLAVALIVLPLLQVWKEVRKESNRKAVAKWFKTNKEVVAKWFTSLFPGRPTGRSQSLLLNELP